jgi:hypothetical protein
VKFAASVSWGVVAAILNKLSSLAEERKIYPIAPHIWVERRTAMSEPTALKNL